MESKYLLEITDTCCSYCYDWRKEGAEERAEVAADRLQTKCKQGRPFTSIHIKNPRYSVED